MFKIDRKVGKATYDSIFTNLLYNKDGCIIGYLIHAQAV